MGWLKKYEEGGPLNMENKTTPYADSLALSNVSKKLMRQELQPIQQVQNGGFLGTTNKPNKYNSAWGGQFQNGGQTDYWNTNKTAWVDSVNHSPENTKKDFIKRYTDLSLGDIQVPGYKYRSTHLMGSNGEGYSFPHIVNQNGKLVYIKSEDDAEDYARAHNEGIQFKNEQQADWYSSNGYKTGTDVKIGKQNGGWLEKYQNGGTEKKVTIFYEKELENPYGHLSNVHVPAAAYKQLNQDIHKVIPGDIHKREVSNESGKSERLLRYKLAGYYGGDANSDEYFRAVRTNNVPDFVNSLTQFQNVKPSKELINAFIKHSSTVAADKEAWSHKYPLEDEMSQSIYDRFNNRYGLNEAPPSLASEDEQPFVTEANNLKNFYSKYNPEYNVRMVELPANGITANRDSIVNANLPANDVVIMGHAGRMLGGIPNKHWGELLNKANPDNCYLGSCSGNDVQPFVDSGLKNVYYRPKGSWYGVNQNANDINSAMYSRSLPKDAKDNKVIIRKPVQGEDYQLGGRRNGGWLGKFQYGGILDTKEFNPTGTKGNTEYKGQEANSYWTDEKTLPRNLRNRAKIGRRPSPQEEQEINQSKEYIGSHPDTGADVYRINGELIRKYSYPDFSVSGSEEVFVKTVDNNIVKISLEELEKYGYEDGMKVLSLNKDTLKYSWEALLQIIKHKTVEPLVKITTRCNRVMKVTQSHSCLTVNADGDIIEIKPSDMKIGTIVPVLGELPIEEISYWDISKYKCLSKSKYVFNTIKLTPNFGFLLGIYLAEGWSGNGKIAIAATESSIRKRTTSAFEELEIHCNDNDSTSIEATCTQLMKALKAEFGVGSDSKYIADWIIGAPKEFREALIDGYWSGDGTINHSSSGGIVATASTDSEELAQGIQLILASLGIQSSIQTFHYTPKGFVNPHLVHYNLCIGSSCIGYLPTITHVEKNQHRLLWVPPKQDQIAIAPVPANLTTGMFKFKGKKGYSGLSKVKRKAKSIKLLKLTEKNILWDRVKSIEESEYEEFTYDLSIDSNHTFVLASGITVHNTEGGNDYAYPGFVPRGEVWLDQWNTGPDADNTLAHELLERQKMMGGMFYDKYGKDGKEAGAHVHALEFENEIRNGKAEVPQLVNKQQQPENNLQPIQQSMQNGGMTYFQNGLDFKPKTISRDGSVVKDNLGYWNPANQGKVVEIGSPNITMEGVTEPLLGVDNEGNKQLMYPGNNYKFQGDKVREYPVAQKGGKYPSTKYGINEFQQLQDFTNKPSNDRNWLKKYEQI